MIKSISFNNFRNLDKKSFKFNDGVCTFVVGKNNTGKSNLLDGIRLAFSSFTDNYFKVNKTDFTNCDDSKPIIISVELTDKISSLSYFINENQKKYGFILNVIKQQNGRYLKKLTLLDGTPFAIDILESDPNIPSIYQIPLIRIEDIYNDSLFTKLSEFITNEDKYSEIINETREKLKNEMKDRREEFKKLCSKFDNNLDIEVTSPKINNQKLYIVDGDKEYNYKIGSGFKSIANIILNSMDENYSIILIDEIENHIHPALLRVLLREMRTFSNTQIISTTHSPVIVNEADFEELIDISGKKFIDLSTKNLQKLKIFLTSERSEIIFADYIILVEGYTEQMLLNHYLKRFNENWTVINVANVMFEPYIELALHLNKKIIVISDDDQSLSSNVSPSSRFLNLKEICDKEGIRILQMKNTLETDLYDNGFLTGEKYSNLLKSKKSENGCYYMVAKQKKKTEIAMNIISDNLDLSDWHIIKDIKDEFESN